MKMEALEVCENLSEEVEETGPVESSYRVCAPGCSAVPAQRSHIVTHHTEGAEIPNGL